MAEEKKIAIGYIGNALRSSAADHTTTFTDEVFDTERQKYQSEVNTDLEQAITDEVARAHEAELSNTTAIEAEKNRAEAAEKAIIFDVSAHNNGAVFDSLSALLSSENLSTLIPTSVRHGGMIIRFIQGSEQSSDNKYIQARCMTQNFTTDVTQWQGVDDEPTAGSENLVKSGGVYNAGQEKVNKSIGVNLIDKRTVKRGYYLDAYGGENPNATYSLTDFVPVEEGLHYCRSQEMQKNFRFVNFFDENRNHISNTQIDNTNAFDCIANAKFVRLSFYDSNFDYVQLTRSDTYLPYVEYTPIWGYMVNKLSENTVNTQNLKDKSVSKSKIQDGILIEGLQDIVSSNLINPDDFVSGYWNQGHHDSDTYSYVKIDISSLIQGTPLTAIYSNGNLANMRFVQFYNDTVFLSGDSNVANADISSGANFVYVTFEKQFIPDLDLANVGVFNIDAPNWEYYSKYTKAKWNSTPNDPKAIARLEDIKGNDLLGKKWVACGDSFTHGDFAGSTEVTTFQDEPYKGKNKVYPYYIGRRTGAIIVDDGVNGSTMAYIDGTHNEFSSANGRYTQIPENADIITLYFGINDAHQNVPIGYINDNVNTTFYGAWNIVLSWIVNNRPNARVGIIITNGSSPEYTAAERAVAQKYGIPYLDLELDLKIPYLLRQYERSVASDVRVLRNTQNAVDYPNNQHPNTKCHEHESFFIEQWIKTL